MRLGLLLRTFRLIALLSFLIPLALKSQEKATLPDGQLRSRQFVYVNNDYGCYGGFFDDCPDNTISAYSVTSDGSLAAIPGSPFDTGGNGGGGWLFASNRISVSTVSDFLFAGNSSSQDVSAFKINPKTGVLTPVKGSPFATDAPTTIDGIAISPTPDGRFLMVADELAVTVFRIRRDGALSRIEESPFPTRHMPVAMKVTPDGKFLAVSEEGLGQIEMFRIAGNGSLTSLGGFPAGANGYSKGVDIDCSSKFLYSGEATAGNTTVDVYRIDKGGSLIQLRRAPFTPGVGIDSQVVLLSADDKQLFVSNQTSNTITVFDVDRNGGLSLVRGSPFPMNGSVQEPAGIAISSDGHLLFAADLLTSYDPAVSVFDVAKTGTLTEVTSSPFAGNGGSGGGQALTVYPSKQCSLLVDNGHDRPEEGRQGDQEKE